MNKISSGHFYLKNQKNGRPVSRVLYPPSVDGEPLSFILLRHHCRNPCSLPLLTTLCEKETKRAALLYRNSGKQSGYIWLCNP